MARKHARPGAIRAAAEELAQWFEKTKPEIDRLSAQLEAAHAKGDLRTMMPVSIRLVVLRRQVIDCQKRSEKLRRQLPA